MKNKKFFGFDVDGTLLTSDHTIAKSTIEVLKEVQEQGHIIAVVTGRGVMQAKPILSLLTSEGINPMLIGNNGSVIGLEDGGIDIIGTVTNKAVQWILDEGEKNHALTIIHHEGNTSYYFSGTEKQLEDINSLGKGVSIPSELLITKEEFYKIALSGKVNQASVKHNPEIAMKLVKEAQIEFKNTDNFVIVGGVYIDANPFGVTKFTAIEAVCKKLGVTKDNIYTFGDSHNDLPMMRKDINSVAMGNAFEEIKDAAKYTTDTNDNDGIAKFINKHVLN